MKKIIRASDEARQYRKVNASQKSDVITEIESQLAERGLTFGPEGGMEGVPELVEVYFDGSLPGAVNEWIEETLANYPGFLVEASESIMSSDEGEMNYCTEHSTPEYSCPICNPPCEYCGKTQWDCECEPVSRDYDGTPLYEWDLVNSSQVLAADDESATGGYEESVDNLKADFDYVIEGLDAMARQGGAQEKAALSLVLDFGVQVTNMINMVANGVTGQTESSEELPPE